MTQALNQKRVLIRLSDFQKNELMHLKFSSSLIQNITLHLSALHTTQIDTWLTAKFHAEKLIVQSGGILTLNFQTNQASRDVRLSKIAESHTNHPPLASSSTPAQHPPIPPSIPYVPAPYTWLPLNPNALSGHYVYPASIFSPANMPLPFSPLLVPSTPSPPFHGFNPYNASALTQPYPQTLPMAQPSTPLYPYPHHITAALTQASHLPLPIPPPAMTQLYPQTIPISLPFASLPDPNSIRAALTQASHLPQRIPPPFIPLLDRQRRGHL
jgi:hypothetical protein